MEETDTSIPGPSAPHNGTITALAGLFEQLNTLTSLDEASIAVVEFAVAHLGSDLAGICLVELSGQPLRLAASSNVLVELDSIEAALGQGPGMVRLDDGAVIRVPDTRADRLWPDWSAAAAEQGMLSVHLVGMPPLRGRSIALQLFSHRVDALADGDRAETLAAVAKLVGLALGHIDRLANLAEAVATRDLIGQALGIVMERYGVTSEQAMQFLRRSSQDRQEKVRHIAQRLVDGDDSPSVAG